MKPLLPAYKEVGEGRYREITGLCYEDFEPGDVFEHRSHHTWRGQLLVHAEKPPVDSSFTLALLSGRSVCTVSAKLVANLGWDKVKAVHPVFAGDTIYAESTVLHERESKSRPTQGTRHGFHSGAESRWHRSHVLRAHHANLQTRPLAGRCRELPGLP